LFVYWLIKHKKRVSVKMNKRLVDVAEVRMGYSFRSRLELNAAGDVAVIQMKDIDELNSLHLESFVRIEMPELREKHLVQVGDILFRSRGNSYAAVVVEGCLGRTVLAAPMMLIRIHVSSIESAYLQWFINQPTTQKTLTAQAAGTAVKMISKAALEQLVIAVPPLEIQQRIVEIGCLASLEARITDQLMDRRKMLVERILMHQAQNTC